MDSFSIIQNFFTRMSCNFCSQPFEADGIELVREEEGVYVVSVFCHHCNRQIGIAMVGVETQGEEEEGRFYPDPELTEEEVERLSQFEPINYDDVLAAHDFFQNLDANWTRFIPQDVLNSETQKPGKVADTE